MVSFIGVVIHEGTFLGLYVRQLKSSGTEAVLLNGYILLNSTA